MVKDKRVKNRFWNVVFGKKGTSAFPAGQGKDEDFYDNCPICQMMKKARDEGREPGEAEIREAYRKAGEEDAVVGGEWFKND